MTNIQPVERQTWSQMCTNYNKEYTLLYVNANPLLIGFALNIRFSASTNVEPNQKTLAFA